MVMVLCNSYTFIILDGVSDYYKWARKISTRYRGTIVDIILYTLAIDN